MAKQPYTPETLCTYTLDLYPETLGLDPKHLHTLYLHPDTLDHTNQGVIVMLHCIAPPHIHAPPPHTHTTTHTHTHTPHTHTTHTSRDLPHKNIEAQSPGAASLLGSRVLSPGAASLLGSKALSPGAASLLGSRVWGYGV